MDKITKNLERALQAMQLVDNEIERQVIMKREFSYTDEQVKVLSCIEYNLRKLQNTIKTVGNFPQPASGL